MLSDGLKLLPSVAVLQQIVTFLIRNVAIVVIVLEFIVLNKSNYTFNYKINAIKSN